MQLPAPLPPDTPEVPEPKPDVFAPLLVEVVVSPPEMAARPTTP